MEVQIIKQAVREVLQEELNRILKEVVLNLIPEDEAGENEKEFVNEKTNPEDYVPLNKVLKKYE